MRCFWQGQAKLIVALTCLKSRNGPFVLKGGQLTRFAVLIIEIYNVLLNIPLNI